MAESTYWNRFWRRRVSRRALLGAGAVTALGAASAAVLGCNSGGGNGNGNGNGTDNRPEAELTPVAGGNVTQGRLLNALGIDPHIDLTGLDIDALMYTYMYSWNRFTEERVMNNLATDLEIVDNLEFIFTIRPDVVAWPTGPAAGEALTSTDCVESFKR
ncbi:MAG: transporter substrate-binding protein, partial [Dehalococcoidia bacterium]|nr:transporter substrate-binding protein [Dehalococcoidia bacterium]